MAGLVPAIHVLRHKERRGCRPKAGHGEMWGGEQKSPDFLVISALWGYKPGSFAAPAPLEACRELTSEPHSGLYLLKTRT